MSARRDKTAVCNLAAALLMRLKDPLQDTSEVNKARNRSLRRRAADAS